jgi:predicted Zn-dependent protease
MIGPLEPEDLFCMQAAEGWLELGSVTEAKRELENLSPGKQDHPGCLSVRWGICAAEKDWEGALEMAARLITLAPEEATGWVDRSYALHELKRTQEARDNLLHAVDRFPLSATMRYNLACYECQLGNLAQARRWLEKAFRLGDRDQMKTAALADPDLQPMWPEIRAS